MTTDSSQPATRTGFWSSIVAAHPSITEVGERRQAQLGASISLVLVLLLSSGFAASSLRLGVIEAFRGFGVGLSAAFVAYILTRLRFYSLGGFILSLGFAVWGLVNILIGRATGAIYNEFLFFGPISLVVGSAILNPWTIFLLTGLNVAICFVPNFIGYPYPDSFGGITGIITAIGLLLILISNFRRSVEQARLRELQVANQKLEAIQFSLEERVEERTVELDRRSLQLEAAAFVARQAAAIQDMNLLLAETVKLISDRFGYYHAGVFLTDKSNQTVNLAAASSEGGQRMLARGHRLEIGREGIVGYAAYQKQAHIALDVGADAVFFNNPDLPKTRSEIALPLVIKNNLIGILDIQSTDANSFQQADIFALQTMADQIALAIENSRLISESRLAIQQLEDVTTETTSRTWRERLGLKHKGYIYTPLGTSQLSEARPPDQAADAYIVSVPIILRGRHIGAIRMSRKGNNAFWSEKEKDLTTDIATQIGLALENARLLEESQKRAIREQTLNEISARLNRSLDIDSLLQTATRELHQLPNVAEVSVYVGQPDESTDSDSDKRK